MEELRKESQALLHIPDANFEGQKVRILLGVLLVESDEDFKAIAASAGFRISKKQKAVGKKKGKRRKAKKSVPGKWQKTNLKGTVSHRKKKN